jgi:type IV pilus assembly protein PilM
MRDRRVIGLDIGSAAVRAAEIVIGSNGPEFVNFGQVALPPGSVAGGVVSDPATVTLAIQRLWKERKFSSKEVLMAVANQQVVARSMDLPWVEPSELKASLPYLVRDVLPLPVEEAVLDFIPLEDNERASASAAKGKRGNLRLTKDKAGSKDKSTGAVAKDESAKEQPKGEPMRGLLVASSRESVATVVQCAERAGLNPRSVDLAAFALLRAVGRQRDNAEPQALVDIGSTVTNIVVHEDGLPRVVRIVLRGGADITAALADRLGVSPAEAEDMKRTHGLVNDGSEAATLIGIAVTPLVEEIRSSLDYFAATHGGIRVSRLVLCGGGAQLPGLAEHLRLATSTDVELVDPMDGITVRPKGIDVDEVQLFRPLSAVSVGLALGATS